MTGEGRTARTDIVARTGRGGQPRVRVRARLGYVSDLLGEHRVMRRYLQHNAARPMPVLAPQPVE